jgi:hypothetical protein
MVSDKDKPGIGIITGLNLEAVGLTSVQLTNYSFRVVTYVEAQPAAQACIDREPVYKLKTKLHGLSPQANYTDRATAACRRSECQLLRIEGATWSA